jgi:predicted neuraminidase
VIRIILTIILLPVLGKAQTNWKVVATEMVVANPPFAACHASTIAEQSPGELVVSFFAGTRESASDVSIWLTRHGSGAWSKPLVVADGIVNDSLRYACWNPVLFKAADTSLFLFYKVGPNPREWWGMLKKSRDGGRSWSKAEKLASGVLGPIKNKPVRLVDGTIVSASSVETNERWKVHVEISKDNGSEWTITPVDTASTFKVIQPAILVHGDSALQLLCRSDQDRIVSSSSYDKGRTWTKFSKLQVRNPNSGIDAITLNDGTHMLVYNPTIRGKDWWNNRGKLNVAVSRDGINWKDVAVLENGTTEEYSYPAIIQSSDGRVHITYTFDRKNIKHVVMEKT